MGNFAPEPTPSLPHLVASDFDAEDDDDDDGDDICFTSSFSL